MTEPDVIDDSARLAADRRDDRRGAIVAGVAIAAVLLVGGLVNLGSSAQDSGQRQSVDAQPSPGTSLQLPTFSLPEDDATPTPSPAPTPPLP